MHQAHILGMTLQEWMATEGLTDDQVANSIKADRSTISRIRRGKIHPSKATTEALILLSGGAIDIASFFDLSGCASEDAA